MKLRVRKNKAFTLIELLAVAAILAIVLTIAMLSAVICMGNFWVTEKGVLKEIQILDPEVTEVMSYHVSVQKPASFRVKRRDGTIERFAVDSNLFFNYQVKMVNDQ